MGDTHEGLIKEICSAAIEKPRPRTLLEIAGRADRETLASRILAFFFDSEEEHGFGELWGKALIDAYNQALNDTDKEETYLEKLYLKHYLEEQHSFSTNCEQPTNHKNKECKYIDIVVETDKYLFVIEHKIKAGQYSPFKHYKEWAEEETGDDGKGKSNYAGKTPVFIVLDPKDNGLVDKAKNNGFVLIHHKDLFNKVMENLYDHLPQASTLWVMHMKDFMVGIDELFSTPVSINSNTVELFKNNAKNIGDICKDYYDKESNDDSIDTFFKQVAQYRQIQKRTCEKLADYLGGRNELTQIAAWKDGFKRYQRNINSGYPLYCSVYSASGGLTNEDIPIDIPIGSNQKVEIETWLDGAQWNITVWPRGPKKGGDELRKQLNDLFPEKDSPELKMSEAIKEIDKDSTDRIIVASVPLSDGFEAVFNEYIKILKCLGADV